MQSSVLTMCALALASVACADEVENDCPKPRNAPKVHTSIGLASFTPSMRAGWKNHELKNSSVRVEFAIEKGSAFHGRQLSRATLVVPFQCDMSRSLGERRAAFDFNGTPLAYDVKGQRAELLNVDRDKVREAARSALTASGIGAVCAAAAITTSCTIGPE